MSSLFLSEPHRKTGLSALATGWSVVGVRDALRSGDSAKINRVVNPFVDRCVVPLERFAGNLLRRGQAAGMSVGKDSGDIAIEAFNKVFALIVGESGDRIRDEEHLLATLFRAARCVWADTLRLPETRHRRLLSDESESHDGGMDQPSAEDEELFGTGKFALEALHILFTDGERFGAMFRSSGAGARHFRQYQALSLYELGERLRDDLDDATDIAEAVVVRFWRNMSLGQICVPAPDWELVEMASISCVPEKIDPVTHLYEALRAAVERVSGADVQNRNKRHILRHEMGKFLASFGSKLGQWETE